MTNQNNPFDFSNLFEQMNPENMAEQFQKMLSGASFGNMDTSALTETQRKNWEALLQANQAMVSGGQALMKRQSEMMQQALQEGADAIQSMSSANPDEIVAKNTELVEQAMGKAMVNFTEIAGMIQQTYDDVSEKVEIRMNENIKEFRETISKTQGQ